MYRVVAGLGSAGPGLLAKVPETYDTPALCPTLRTGLMREPVGHITPVAVPGRRYERQSLREVASWLTLSLQAFPVKTRNFGR